MLVIKKRGPALFHYFWESVYLAKLGEKNERNKQKQQKFKEKIFGRWVNDIGISLTSGAVISNIMTEWKFWYFLIVGASLVFYGTELEYNIK